MLCGEIQERWKRITTDTQWVIQSEGGVFQGIIPIGSANLFQINSGIQKPLPAIPRNEARAHDNTALLNAYYAKPSDFTTCAAGTAKPHPMTLYPVRSWMIGNLASPPSAPAAAVLRTTPIAPGSAFDSSLVSLVVNVLTKEAKPGAVEAEVRQRIAAAYGTSLASWIPKGLAWLSTLQKEREAIVTALCACVITAGSVGIDAVAWPLLWAWAIGKPPGGPAPLTSTRAAAINAIGAVAKRRPSLVSRTTIDSMKALAASVDAMLPTDSWPEQQARQAFADQAGQTVGDLQGALMAKNIPVPPELTDPSTYLPPGTPPPGSIPIWVPIVGAAGLLAAVAGGVLLRRAQRS